MILLILQFSLVSCNFYFLKTTASTTITTTITFTITITTTTTNITITPPPPPPTNTTNNNSGYSITSYIFYVLTKYRNNFQRI